MDYGDVGAQVTGKLASVVSSSDLSGVMNEILALLPVIIPVMIGFIGLRKAISFLIGMLHSA